MQFTIRELKLEDAAPVNRLSKQLGYSLSCAETAERLKNIIAKNDHAVFVATINNNVVGWIHAFQSFQIESLPFVEIGGLVVDEVQRGKGIGKALINEVKEWCEQQEIHRLHVRTQTKRLDAQQSYKASGFEEIKEQKVYQMNMLPENKNDHQS